MRDVHILRKAAILAPCCRRRPPPRSPRVGLARTRTAAHDWANLHLATAQRHTHCASMASPTPPQSSTPQPLDISDLIRPLSPSPLPPASRASSPAQSRSSASPEPIDRAELDEIRSKVLEMGIVRDGRKNSIARLDKTWSDMSTFGEDRERVLAEMVLRLTHPSVPLPSQLFAQAETISTLNKQRDFILSRDEDDRVRWDAEREAWRRVAGVLLERSQKEGAGIREVC
ncbi:hypothetical protein BOTBODRAFT_293972 [Botryobasidium botryosum FD-172 SS1]|uniref:Uncharacterized protein n=1 Tax=Botryobasidium botryosum (strain FD-172 SS1) TaxID=930990 RepID=A0A067MVD2_BOTB1|nr:hypothetical protein BOTBODRAFT_293972 [Botryobasidium botryosum FD-172 SS1]